MRRAISILLSVVMLAGVVIASGGDSKPRPEIHIRPLTALLDEPVSIRLTGLAPGQSVTLRATSDIYGRTWQSHAEFTADAKGVVDLSKQAPTKGTYSGLDPMGLFWSMDVLAQPQQGADHHSAPGPRREMKLDLEADGKVITTATVIRLHVAEDVRSVEVRDNGLVAKLYEPVKGGPRPGILVLGGSEGGIRSAESRAAILASHGYAALAVAYFGMDGLPPRLIGIPLEYLKKAIDSMTARDTIDRNRLAVIGGSKGAELALLLASSFPELKAVVAYAPSSVAWPGIGGPGPSWTYQGKPVEFVPYGAGPKPNPADGGKTMILMPLYLKSLDNAEAVKTASITVERINGPVLLISGKDDQLWPSTVLGDAVMARFKEKNHRFKYEHLAYDKAGHSIGTPYNPTTRSTSGGTLALGGSAEANARAQADSWPKVLRFLEENLMKLKRK